MAVLNWLLSHANLLTAEKQLSRHGADRPTVTSENSINLVLQISTLYRFCQSFHSYPVECNVIKVRSDQPLQTGNLDLAYPGQTTDFLIIQLLHCVKTGTMGGNR